MTVESWAPLSLFVREAQGPQGTTDTVYVSHPTARTEWGVVIQGRNSYLLFLVVVYVHSCNTKVLTILVIFLLWTPGSFCLHYPKISTY